MSQGYDEERFSTPQSKKGYGVFKPSMLDTSTENDHLLGRKRRSSDHISTVDSGGEDPIFPITPKLPKGAIVERNGQLLLCGVVSVETYNLIVHSIAFMLMFSAYNTLQNFITSLLAKNHLGDNSMLVVYVVVVMALFPAPIVVEKFGQRRCMVLGFIFYFLYMSSMLYVIDYVVLTLAGLAGLGTAIMWVAQGAYLTDLSTDERRGLNCGIFFSIFQSSYVFGNIMAFFVFRDLNKNGLFIMFVILAALGTLTLLMLIPYKKKKSAAELTTHADNLYYSLPDSDALHSEQEVSTLNLPTTEHNPEKVMSVPQLLFSSIRALRHWELLILIPCFFFMGFELSFWTGQFTLLLDKGSIGIVLSFAGLGEVLGASVLGWLSDKVGKTPTALCGMVFFFIAFYLTVVIKWEDSFFVDKEWLGAPWSAYVAAFCFGHADGIINTLIYALLGHVYANESTPVFTVFQVFMDLGTAFGYFIFPRFPVQGAKGSLKVVWALVGLTVVSFAGFVTADLVEVCRSRRLKKELAEEEARHDNCDPIIS